MKKYFLSSMLVMGLMVPAFGADEIITGGANTCTVDVLGVSDNNATANTIATWTLNEYECGAGQYLLNSDGTLECTECPVGSYCPGGKFTVESENNGTNACPTDYTSDPGAVGENECYMGCELSCSVNTECPPHSNNCTHSEFKTTGKQFAGSTCNAYPSVCPVADFQCDTGYSVITGNLIEVLDFSWVETITDLSFIKSCSLNNEDEMIDGTDNGINDCDFVEPGQLMLGDSVLFEFSANQYDANTPGVVRGEYYCTEPGDDMCYFDIVPKYLKNANFDNTITGDNLWLTIKKVKIPSPDTMLLEMVYEEFMNSGNLSDATLNLLEKSLKPQNWANVQELLNKIASNSFANEDELTQAANRTLTSSYEWMDVNMPWFEYVEYGATNSQFSVLFTMFYNEEYLKHVNQEDLMLSICFNNVINVNWNPDNGDVLTQNMCIYDSTVILPADPVKPGYTFTGWKLVE